MFTIVVLGLVGVSFAKLFFQLFCMSAIFNALFLAVGTSFTLLFLISSV